MKLRIFVPVIFLALLGESPANNLSSSTNQVTQYQQCTNSAETELNQLLAERIKHPEHTLDIDNKIYKTFSRTTAIMVLDTSGFSSRTIKYGIIDALSMLQRLIVITNPIIEKHGGRVVKQEADNIFAVFPNARQALEASVETMNHLSAVDLHASIGIGYGEILMVGNNRMYGNEMNFTSKLGEDIAQRDEILLTEAAFQEIGVEPKNWEKLEVSISGLKLTAYRMKAVK